MTTPENPDKQVVKAITPLASFIFMSRWLQLPLYLGLIVALRGGVPGTAIPLRQSDLEVLSDALLVEPEDIEERLALLMTNPRDRVGRRCRRLSRRAVVPEAGILVAATGEGLLVLDGHGVQTDDGIAVYPEVTGATIIALARRDVPSSQSFAARTA